MKKSRTSPYHPQCDCMVERYNRTLLDMLATMTQNHPFDWEDQLPKVCMAYNTNIHASTGYSPLFLMFSRPARMPIDLMYDSRNEAEVPTMEHAVATREALQEAYRFISEKLGVAHARRKEYYDQKVHGQPFAVGNLVWLHSSVVPRGKSRKLHHPWSGPFKILQNLSEANYRIKKLTGNRRIQVIHFDHLKLCTPGTRLTVDVSRREEQPCTPDHVTVPDCFGENMEPLDCEDEEPHPIPLPTLTRNYPQRNRYRPTL